MAIDVVGSHMAPEAFTGQNGGLNPSSIKKGEKIPRSTVAKSIISADGSVSAAPGDWQTRSVSSAQVVPTKLGMERRQGAIPKASPVNGPTGNRRTNDGPIRAN
jgi:hypothetical protein